MRLGLGLREDAVDGEGVLLGVVACDSETQGGLYLCHVGELLLHADGVVSHNHAHLGALDVVGQRADEGGEDALARCLLLELEA